MGEKEKATEKTVAELREEARKLDIEGRSQMDKEELAEAVATAEHSGGEGFDYGAVDPASDYATEEDKGGEATGGENFNYGEPEGA